MSVCVSVLEKNESNIVCLCVIYCAVQRASHISRVP